MTSFYATYWAISALISVIIALILTVISIRHNRDSDPIGSILYHTIVFISYFIFGLGLAFATCFSFSHTKESKPTWKTIYPNDQNVTLSLDNRYLDKSLTLTKNTQDSDVKDLASDGTKLILTHDHDNKTTKIPDITVKGTGYLKTVRYKTYSYNFYLWGHKLFKNDTTAHGLVLEFENDQPKTNVTLDNFLK